MASLLDFMTYVLKIIWPNVVCLPLAIYIKYIYIYIFGSEYNKCHYITRG